MKCVCVLTCIALSLQILHTFKLFILSLPLQKNVQLLKIRLCSTEFFKMLSSYQSCIFLKFIPRPNKFIIEECSPF